MAATGMMMVASVSPAPVKVLRTSVGVPPWAIQKSDSHPEARLDTDAVRNAAAPHTAIFAAGKWCAIQNGVGNLAGVSAPWITGWVVGVTGHFFIAFLVAALVAIAGAGMFVLGVGPIKPVIFAPRRQTA